MNKKDIIIVAALLNAATLAALFMLAVRIDDEAVIHPSEIVHTETLLTEADTQEATPWTMADTKIYATDEVDDILREFDALASAEVIPEIPKAVAYSNPEQKRTIPEIPDNFNEEPLPRFVDVTVKKGDILDRIARSNGTTVTEIKRVNNLKSERLSIGQVLKVPVGVAKKDSEPTPKHVTEQKQPNASVAKKTQAQSPAGDTIYYTIKSGDSPWKISKQMNIKMEDLLELNHLDEEKARNLKIGDRIRIR